MRSGVLDLIAKNDLATLLRFYTVDLITYEVYERRRSFGKLFMDATAYFIGIPKMLSSIFIVLFDGKI
jgi:hypothetical protein